MTKMSSHRFLKFLASALSLGAVLVLAPAAFAEEVTQTYRVKRGDTCPKIAEAVYGPGTKWSVIHEFNPQVGPLLPCRIRKGMNLILPVRDTDPAAELTAIERDVETRTPSAAKWKVGARGQDLFRGWRVSTRAESAAEITFRDDSVIEMRENALVIIFGSSSRQARRRTSRARLERGSLRNRLGELAGGSSTLNVETPSGLASFSGGQSVISVGEDGTSLVCNHEGEAAVVTSSAAPRAKVKVKKGMGSKVVKGKKPSKPRPLPAAPTWQDGPVAFATLSEKGTLTGAWNAAPAADMYRVEIAQGANGEKVVAAARVHHSAERTFRLEGLPPSIYYVRLSTIDAEGFESVPAPSRKMELLALQVAPPGGESFAHASVEKGKAPAVLQGTLVQAPSSMRCTVSDTAGSNPMVLATPGEQTIICRKGEDTLYRAAVNVVPLAVEFAAGEKGEIQTERGTPQRFEATFSAPDVAIPENVRIIADPGLQIEASTLTEDGRAAFTVTADATAKNPSFVYVVAGEGPKPYRLMRVAVNITEAKVVEVPVTNTPDMRPPGGQEALNGMLLPYLVGVDDEQRNGFGGWVSMAPLAILQQEDSEALPRTIRVVPGLEANVASDRLRLTLAGPFSIDTDGAVVKGGDNRGLFVGLGWRIQPRTLDNRWGLSIGSGLSAPVFDDDGDYRVRPALDFSYALTSTVIARMRQAALIDAAEDAAAYWASAYALEFRATRSFSFGAEAALSIGRTDESVDQTMVTVGLPLAVHSESFSVSLTPHLPITVDAQRALGKFFAVLDFRVRL